MIERALESDRPAIESLLLANGLPLDGLEMAMPTAVVAREADGLVGCAALEPYGSIGLLRSVCVAVDRRGTGLGRELVAAAERLAIEIGTADLFLLTETAETWFPRLGYRPTSRASVPDVMSASAELTGACPDSAVILSKRL